MAQRNVNQTTFPTIHRIKPEIVARMLHTLSRIQRTAAQFFKPQGTIVVGVERNPRVIVGMHPEQLHGHQFHRQQQLCLVGEQHVDVVALELYHQIRVLKLGVALVSRTNLERQIKTSVGDDLIEERFDARSGFVNRILCRQPFFLPSLELFEAWTRTVLSGAVLLKNHCCAIPTTLLVSQYNTRPLEADQKK